MQVGRLRADLDERAAGNTVWGYIGRGRGIDVVNESIAEQLPRGVTLLDLAEPQPRLKIDAVWQGRELLPTVERALGTAALLASERRWLVTGASRSPPH